MDTFRFLPEDAELIGSNAHHVYRSMSESKVYRVDPMDDMVTSNHILDTVKAHTLAWHFGKERRLKVLAPLTPLPKIIDGYLISEYPLMRPVLPGWVIPDGEAYGLGKTMASWSTYSGTPTLPTLSVPTYVNERLAIAVLNVEDSIKERVESLRLTFNALNIRFPYARLQATIRGHNHGDLHRGNFVLDQNDSILVIDFDSFKYGSPLYDIGIMRVTESKLGEDHRVSNSVLEGLHAYSRSGHQSRNSFWLPGQAVAGEAWKRVSSLSRLLCLCDASGASLTEFDAGYEQLVECINQLG